MFIPDEGEELQLSANSLVSFLHGNPMTGMARLGNGFIYVLEDGAHVIGLDGNIVDRACLKRLNSDSRIESLIAWGDQPPPITRKEFIACLR